MGASVPGMPMVLIGRTKYIAWGITAAMTDVSDLFKEKIDNSTKKYFVDG